MIGPPPGKEGRPSGERPLSGDFVVDGVGYEDGHVVVNLAPVEVGADWRHVVRLVDVVSIHVY